MNTSLSPDQRADLLAAAMTLDQKVALFNVNGTATVPELKVPPRHEIDGSLGIHSGVQPTTAMPSGLSLAASFDRSLAKRWGAQTAREAFELGFDGDAAPTLDIARSPYWGRAWEGLGEDPILSGLLGSSEIKGIQSQKGVYALVKHFGVYTQETGRATLDNQVSERTVRELYLRNWDIAVNSAHPGAVMCAFPKINGDYACEDPHLLQDILKSEWGYQGFVSSDFNACHGFNAFTAGADHCGDGFPTFNELLGAVQDGSIPMSRFDDMVHRVLRTMFAEGLFENRAPGTTGTTIDPSSPLPASVIADGEDIAEQAAVAGSVLLKNTGVLPLKSSTKSLAVIGAGADEYIDGTGSPQVPLPAKLTTVLDGLTARASATDVQYAAGTDDLRLGDVLPGPAPVPSSVLKPSTGSGSGLTGEYFPSSDFTNGPVESRVDDQVNIRTGLAALIDTFDPHTRTEPSKLPSPLLFGPNASIRWTGTLNPVVTGTYKLALTHLGSASLFVNGKQVLHNAGKTLGTQTASLKLTAGQSYDIKIEYVEDAPGQCCITSDGEGPTVRFGWVPPSDTASPQIQAAVALAKKSDVAVVVVRDEVGEATDRYTLGLPQDQDRLIRAVAKVNPHTVVVSATSGPVLMPWLSKVQGVVQAWYPGEAGGKAIASLLYGDANFGGKLPVTFPKSESQVSKVVPDSNPTSDFGKGATTLKISEGVYSGYRGYQKKNTKPLFPFGYGLSYSSYKYSGLSVKASVPAVTVKVRNIGGRKGTEKVQVYVGKLPTSVATPKRQLAGFARVTLAPGKQKTVTVPIDTHALEYWSTTHERFMTPSGKVKVYVGTSSSTATLTGTLQSAAKRTS